MRKTDIGTIAVFLLCTVVSAISTQGAIQESHRVDSFAGLRGRLSDYVCSCEGEMARRRVALEVRFAGHSRVASFASHSVGRVERTQVTKRGTAA